MNENFEHDKLIQELRKAAKPVRAPKLSEDALLSASSAPAKTSMREHIAMARSSTRFSLAGAAAVVAISALILGSLNTGHANIHISLGSSGAQGPAGVSSTSDKVSAGYQMRPYMPAFLAYKFYADSTLSKNEGSGNIYRVDQPLSVAEIMKKVSEYFGLKTKLEETSSSEDGIRQLVDGNLFLTVNTLGQFVYWNNDTQGWGPCIREGKANVTVDKNLNPNGTTDASAAPTTYCEEHGPYTQTKLPSDSEAKTQAVKLFSDLGFSVNESDISLDRYNDPSFATLSATASLKADGLPTSFEWKVTWSNTGQIENMSGYAVKLVNVGSVPTISPTAAVDRLSDHRWSAWSASNYYFAGTPWNVYKTLGMPAGLDDTPNVVTPSVVAQPSVGPTDSPTPVEPPLVDFRVLRGELAMGTISDSKGQTWILPSYALYGDANNDTGLLAGIVLAVQDGVIDLPTLPAVSPLLLPY
jgi:hypothetical protein